MSLPLSPWIACIKKKVSKQERRKMAENSKKLKIALKKIKSDGAITVFFPQLGEDLILQVWAI